MKSKLIELARKQNIDIEIAENRGKIAEITVMDDTLKLFQITDTRSYLIKALRDDRFVQILTESLNNPEKIIKDINTLFEISENDNKNTLAKGNVCQRCDEEEIDLKKAKEDLLSLNELKKEYHEIISIEASFEHVTRHYYINNSDCELEDEVYFNGYSAEITVEKSGIRKVFYMNYYSKSYDFETFKEKLIEKLKNVIIKLDSDSVKTNKYNIILKNSAVASILGIFADAFQSKAIYLKNSVLTDKFNEKVFSDKVTIVEDPRNGVFGRYFDSEGTETKYKELIKDGKFVTEINNVEYALKLGIPATGNAYGVNNMILKPGCTSYNELVKKLDNGIIIDEVWGLHSGIDKKDGNISLQAEGLLVENGKIVKGLEMIILSTDFFEIFNNIVEIGDDLSSESTDVLAPSLLLNDITISGKE